MVRKPAFNYFSTSLIFRMISDFILRKACHIGGHSGFTRILCMTISVSNPGISWKDQAKIPLNSLSSAISSGFMSLGKFSLISMGFSFLPLLARLTTSVYFMLGSDPLLSLFRASKISRGML